MRGLRERKQVGPTDPGSAVSAASWIWGALCHWGCRPVVLSGGRTRVGTWPWGWARRNRGQDGVLAQAGWGGLYGRGKKASRLGASQG